MSELLTTILPVFITGFLTLLGVIFKDYLPGLRQAKIQRDKEKEEREKAEKLRIQKNDDYQEEVRRHLNEFVTLFKKQDEQLRAIDSEVKNLQNSDVQNTKKLVEMTSGIAKMEEELKISNEQVKISYEAQLAVCRDRIMQFYKYHLRNDRAGLTTEEMETIEALYEAYKKLGGNHFVDRLMSEMRTWPLIPINKAIGSPTPVKNNIDLNY